MCDLFFLCSLTPSYSVLIFDLYSVAETLSSLRRLLATVTDLEASKTYTTGPEYTGSIFSAVCNLEVVAPPINNGIFILSLCISEATYTISSNEGVINPLKPMMSTLCSWAALIILSAETITPKSIIS